LDTNSTEKKNRAVKILFSDFQQKLILLCLIRSEPPKKNRLERDVIQKDVENPDSEDGGRIHKR